MRAKKNNSQCKKEVCCFRVLRKVILLLFILVLNVKVLSKNLAYQNRCYMNNFLEMKGCVKQARNCESGSLKRLDSANIVVLNEANKVIKNLYSNKAGMCLIILPLNEHFIIRVLKSGWITKIIDIDTRCYGDRSAQYYLNFEIDMFEDIYGLDASVLKQPIADVVFNKFSNRFDYNYKYTDNINKKLRKLYTDYYRSQKENNIIRNNELISENNLSKSNRSSLNYKCESSNKNNKSFDEVEELASVNLKNKVQYHATFIDTATSKRLERNKALLSTDNTKGDLVFKIQIIALDGCLPRNAKFFERCGEAKEHVHMGKYKYTLGEFKTIEAALRMLDVVRGIGYSDAFPVAFFNSERISIAEARALQNESKK
jgi:hypothetical protein